MIDREVMRFGFRQMRRTRKFHFAALVSLLPFIAGVLMFLHDGTMAGKPGYTFHPGFTETFSFFILSGTVPFVALLLAGGLLADEAEDRTLTYLLVRPIRRSTLYISKALPVLLTTMAFAVAQSLLLGLTRIVAWFAFGQGTTVAAAVAPGEAPRLVASGAVLLATIPAGILVAALVGGVLATLFGFISIVTTRFHFFANLLILVVWEFPFSRLGSLGLLTITYHGLSIMDRVDATIREDLVGSPVHPVIALVWLMASAIVWLWCATGLVQRRGFHVTSAAT